MELEKQKNPLLMRTLARRIKKKQRKKKKNKKKLDNPEKKDYTGFKVTKNKENKRGNK